MVVQRKPLDNHTDDGGDRTRIVLTLDGPAVKCRLDRDENFIRQIYALLLIGICVIRYFASDDILERYGFTQATTTTKTSDRPSQTP